MNVTAIVVEPTNSSGGCIQPAHQRHHFAAAGNEALSATQVVADCQPATGHIYTDPTDHFLVSLDSGNAYMLIMYN